MAAPAYEPITRLEILRYHSARPGSRALQRAIINVFADRGAVDLGVIASAAHNRANPTSLHRVGRAGDIGARTLALLKEIALRLVANATDFGVCEVICDDHRWTGDQGVQPYHGSDRHRTHLHWGQTRAAASSSADPHVLVELFEFILRKR